MSILDTNAPVIPIEIKQRQVASSIAQNVRSLYAQMVGTYNRCTELLWHNDSGLTPQQVLAGIDIKAVELFTLATLLRNTVNQAKPGTLPEPTLPPYTANQDGSITLGGE